MKTTIRAIFCTIISLFIFSTFSFSQLGVEVLTSGTNTSLRGLSVVNDQVIWVSGSNGTIGKSLNGGKNWKWTVVKGFEKNDFRYIEAFDATTAVIMSVGEPAYILKTVNGGESWKVVFEDKTPGMFLDAISIYFIFLPLLIPIAVHYHWNLVWLGIVITMNLAIGQFTPPMAVNLLVTTRIADVTIESTVPWVTWFVAAMLAGLLLITFIPVIVLWLPRMLGYL